MPAGGGAVVVLLLLVVLVKCSGGGGKADNGACMKDLLRHLDAKTGLVLSGTDLDQARGAGFDVSANLEDLGAAQEQTGALPDPLTARVRYQTLASVETFTARTGVNPRDMYCSLGDANTAVFTGSFDVAAVKGSDLGSDGALAASEDRLALTRSDRAAAELLKPIKKGSLADNAHLVAVLNSLRAQGAYSLVVERSKDADGDVMAAGIGVGGKGDDRTLVLAWSFKDDAAAKSGRPLVVEKVNSVARGSSSITSADLTVDGRLVFATVPTIKALSLTEVVNAGTTLLPPAG